MIGVIVHQYQAGKVAARLDAESAEWHDGIWEFHDGYYRTFSDGREHAERFRVMRLPDLLDSPEDLARLEPQPEAMNYRQLRAYVDKVRSSGGKVDAYLVQLYEKVSDPFANLVLSILGVGLAASKRKPSLAAGFGLTLAICFTYLTVKEICGAFGQNEAIPPYLAAWLSPALFGAAGVALLRRANL